MYEVVSKEWILPAAIDQGIWLSDKQIEYILGSLGCDMPNKTEGSGRKGAVTKYDRALHLMRFLFSEAPRSEITRMVNSLMNWTKPKVDLSLLSHVAEIDPENADSFRKDVQDAVREFAAQAFQKGKEFQEGAAREAQAQEARKSAESAEKALHEEADSKAVRAWNCTPDTLKTLLPGAGSVKGVFGIGYAASQKIFRAVYPIGRLALHFTSNFQSPRIPLALKTQLTNLTNQVGKVGRAPKNGRGLGQPGDCLGPSWNHLGTMALPIIYYILSPSKLNLGPSLAIHLGPCLGGGLSFFLARDSWLAWLGVIHLLGQSS